MRGAESMRRARIMVPSSNNVRRALSSTLTFRASVTFESIISPRKGAATYSNAGGSRQLHLPIRAYSLATRCDRGGSFLREALGNGKYCRFSVGSSNHDIGAHGIAMSPRRAGGADGRAAATAARCLPQLARLQTDAGDSRNSSSRGYSMGGGGEQPKNHGDAKVGGGAISNSSSENPGSSTSGDALEEGDQAQADQGEAGRGAAVSGAKGITAIRERLRDAGMDAKEDAKGWIREKQDGMGEMKETLMEARSEGRLREELSEQAKERSGRLKVLWRKYGAVGIGCYAGIYVGSISLLYVIYDYGVMTSMPSGGATVIEKMQQWMLHTPDWSRELSDRLFNAMATDHRARSFVLAWATAKVLEPLRLIAAIAVTPTVARALGRAPAKGVDDEDDDDNSGDVKNAGKKTGGEEKTEGGGGSRR